jgi:hypothetical protein
MRNDWNAEWGMPELPSFRDKRRPPSLVPTTRFFNIIGNIDSTGCPPWREFWNASTAVSAAGATYICRTRFTDLALH